MWGIENVVYVPDQGSLAGDKKDSTTGVILREIFGNTDAGGAPIAAEHVEHNAVHVGSEAQVPSKVQVPAG